MPRMAIYKYVYYVAMSMWTVGCTVGPNFTVPDAPRITSYTESPQSVKTVSSAVKGGNEQTITMNQDIPLHWWGVFHSEELNQLIVKGLHNNQTLQAGQAALMQAQEDFRAQVGTYLYPAFDLQTQAQRERFSGSSFGSPNANANTFNLYNTQVNVSYALDFFGGARRELEALCATVEYQRYQLEGTYLALTANIVTTAITEASLYAQRNATIEIIKLEEDVLNIIKKQYEIGAIALSNVLSQENQVAQTKATLPPIEKNLAQNRHALAVLIGEFPSEAHLPTISLNSLQLPSELPLSLPSNLVQQRPDIRAQEALLHQASAQIGVATANMLPQITLNGYYGWQANKIGDLFLSSMNIWSIAAQGLQPLFHGGALLAKKRSALAAYEQAFAKYRQTVLLAFQNVADVLRAIEFDAKTLQSYAQAETAAKNLLMLTKQQYSQGAVNYLSLLDAQRQYQQSVINRIQAQANRFNDTAALFQALGGSWCHPYPRRNLANG